MLKHIKKHASLWNTLMLILAAFLINSTFYFIPYLLPRVNTIELLTYQIFANGLLLLTLVLPRNLWAPPVTEPTVITGIPVIPVIPGIPVKGS